MTEYGNYNLLAMIQKPLYVILFLILFSCGTDPASKVGADRADDSKTVTASVNDQVVDKWQEKPFRDLDVEFLEFKYNNKKGLEFNLPSGTAVKIPANAFQDADGKPVTSNVVVKYREFQNVNDIIIAGIKMKYSEDSINGDFESAGMFEIRAFTGENELDLRKNKTVDVDLASFKSGAYNSYVMNEATNNWEFIDKQKAKPNKHKKEKLKEIDSTLKALTVTCVSEPTEFKGKMEVFDLDYDIDRFYEMDFVSEAMWIPVGDEKEKAQLRSSLSGFDDMQLVPASEECNTFKLSVWKKNGINPVLNKKTFLVKPVFKGKSLSRAKKRYTEHVAELKKKGDERQVAEREADLWRSFQLKGMGVYNCDRIVDYIDFITLNLEIKYKDEVHSYYYLTGNGNVAVKYYPQYLSNFRFNPNSTNSIIAILPDNQVGVVSEKEFEKAYNVYLKDKSPDKKLRLDLRLKEEPVKNRKDFDQYVAKI